MTTNWALGAIAITGWCKYGIGLCRLFVLIVDIEFIATEICFVAVSTPVTRPIESLRMRLILNLSVATAVLFGAYTYSFGLPKPVVALMDKGQGTTAAPEAAEGGEGRPERGQGGGRGGNSATTVVTVPLALAPYETVFNAIGTASALQSAEVVSESAGEVVEVNLPTNSAVTAGDVLLRLDAKTQEINLDIAQAQLDQANETVARYDRLRANGNGTVTDVTMSEAQIAKRLAEANVGLAQIALDNRTMRAPISGKLGLSDIHVGDMLSANDAIVSIDDDAALIIAFELSERAIGILSQVETISASTPTFTGRVFDGKIISFDSRLDSVTRSVTVNARIENADGLLWPGMTFSVRMFHENAPLPAVPSTAITWSRAGSSIWIDDAGKAKQIPVTILFRQNETVWIEADLPEGTAVVSEGAQKLRDGAAITTPDATPPSAPSSAEASK